MRAIITVLGKDRVGIIAQVCAGLSENGVNVLDITQTLLQDYFTMVMLVDASGCRVSFGELKSRLIELGEEMGMSIRIQNEEIFNAMHKI